MVKLIPARSFAFAALLVFTRPGQPQESAGFQRGTIIEKVATRDDPGQSYALYLPSRYSPERRWPIVYGFDPGARGRMPVELMRAAAEELGFIVVGSNNSRNGPMEIIGRAVVAVWNDTHLRFPIDEGLVFAAGFSGGGQVALNLGPSLNRPVTGVITCCRGLPEELKIEQLAGTAIFCATGTTDFNYREVEALDRLLGGTGAAHRMEVFAGPHSWAPETMMADGLRWLALHAMKAGKMPRNEELMERIFAQEQSLARAARDQGRLTDAARHYSALRRDFAGVRPMAQADAEAGGLASLPDLAKQIKEEQKLAEKEESRLQQLQAVFASINDPSLEVFNSGRFVAQMGITALRKDAAKTPSAESAMAGRLLAVLFDNTRMAGDLFMQRKDYRRAVLAYEVRGAIDPDDWTTWYQLACAHALQKDKKAALQMLSRAVEKGFSDRQLLESDSDLAALREEKGYQELRDKLTK